jgi:hypothetical protein
MILTSPTGFCNAGNQAFGGKHPEADAAHLEIPHVAAGTTANSAAIVLTTRKLRFSHPFLD